MQSETKKISASLESEASMNVLSPSSNFNSVSPIKTSDNLGMNPQCDNPLDIKQEESGLVLKEDNTETDCKTLKQISETTGTVGNKTCNELTKIKKEDLSSPQLSPKEYGSDGQVQIVLPASEISEPNLSSHNNMQKHLSNYGNNGIDYIQNQNHIFVFSTQLANKGAESVMNGQYPTIIAYHCMQPTTKHFLDEFFTKNPMKISKFHRQSFQSNSTQLWNNNCNTNLPPKSGNKSNHNIHSPNDKMGQNSMTDPTNLLQNNEDFLNWEANNSSTERDGLKIFDKSELVLNSQSVINKGMSPLDVNSELSSIPSLQGVKVPDENLTPQQRQHREEQLAKLKKMNQFLFPETVSEDSIDKLNESSNGSHSIKATGKNMESVNFGIGNHCNESTGISQTNSLPNQNIVPFQGPMSNPCKIVDCNSKQPKVMNCDPLRSNIIQTSLNNNSGNKREVNEPSKSCGSNISVNCNSQFNDNTKTLNADAEYLKKNGSGKPERHTSLNKTPHDPENTHSQDWQKSQTKQALESNGLNRTVSSTGNSNRVNNNGPSNSSMCTTNQNLRNLHGPPPPYHSTPRSASVPISTHSPNPSSPSTNPTSAISLPSPRTSSTISHMSNSPVLETIISSGITPTTTTSTSSIGAVHPKNCFGSEEQSTSVASINRSRIGTNQVNNNCNANKNGGMQKEIEIYNTQTSEEVKTIRYGPQRSKTPISSDNKYTTNNPSINFSHQFPSSSYKLQGLVERSNCSSQYSKRAENLPLNPNNSRNSQAKPITGFDPISSLAQMSQQLTSNTLNTSLGHNTSGLGLSQNNDLNVESGGNQNIDNSLKVLDGCLEGCSLNTSNSIGALPPHLNSNSHSLSVSCQSTVGNIVQRSSMGQKNCANFSTSTSIVRDAPGNYTGSIVGPPSRLYQNRMNYGYNVPPNVQVRATTPNTIQYMPVRPQNNNCGIRMAPSVEFLQRYTNPAMPGNISQADMNIVNHMNSNDANKVSDSENRNQSNFYQHDNNMSLIGTENDQGLIGYNDSDLNLIRGVRSMRPHLTNTKLQTNTLSNSNLQDSNEVNSDTGPIICNIYNSMNQHMFQNPQSKNVKNSACNNLQSANEHTTMMHSQINTGCIVNPDNNFKFLGNTQNDVKYAQQYHSFQQQLYATSTRGQHGPNSSNVNNSNQFFANK